jgi:hypothetical protein
VTPYFLIKADLYDLPDEVNKAIEEGYAPLGGPVMVDSSYGGTPMFVQAMLYKGKEEEDET